MMSYSSLCLATCNLPSVTSAHVLNLSLFIVDMDRKELAKLLREAAELLCSTAPAESSTREPQPLCSMSSRGTVQQEVRNLFAPFRRAGHSGTSCRRCTTPGIGHVPKPKQLYWTHRFLCFGKDYYPQFTWVCVLLKNKSFAKISQRMCNI